MSKRKPWSFEEDNGTLVDVMEGSGHYSQILNTKTGKVVRSIYVFEAEFNYPGGKRHNGPVSRAQLVKWRKIAQEQGSGVQAVYYAGEKR